MLHALRCCPRVPCKDLKHGRSFGPTLSSTFQATLGSLSLDIMCIVFSLGEEPARQAPRATRRRARPLAKPDLKDYSADGTRS